MDEVIRQATEWLNSILPPDFAIVPSGHVDAFGVRTPDGVQLDVWHSSDDGIVGLLDAVLAEAQNAVLLETKELWPPAALPCVPRVDVADGTLDVGYANASGWVLRHQIAMPPDVSA